MRTLFSNIFDIPFLARGFRPFFLLGALYSVINIFIWGGFYAGLIEPPTIFSDPISWHAHEMIYGFSLAIVAGFLLTAVANWTGGAPARQMHLAGLCTIWLAGRIVMNVELDLSNLTILIIENSFIPALAISLSIPLLKSWNKRNFVFLGLLTILFVCDLLFFITEERGPLYAAIMIIITMISLVGGRIIPAFTVAALRREGKEAYQTPQNVLDVMALVSLIVIVFTLLLKGPQGYILGSVALISMFIHLYRMRVYHTLRILQDPMVWILHAGYAWVIIGLFLISMSGFGFVPFSTALHALTVGAIGSMTLGMMCRVSLGHTGRDLKSTKVTTLSFICIQIAVLLRVLCPLMMPEHTSTAIIISAVVWSLCFLVYVAFYASILWGPRPDGRPA